jgi:hypothetical protein
LFLSLPQGGEEIDVSRIVVHPRFTAFNNDQSVDIAILVLSHPISASSGARPVAVAGPENSDLEAPGSMATVPGWGSVNENSDLGPFPTELRVRKTNQREEKGD